MQSLQYILVIVNILFVISHEGVKATLFEKGRACNHSEENKVTHQIVEEVASSIYNKYFKGSHNDKKNEVSVIGSLVNTLVRNEQEKAEKNSKVKEKEMNDGNIKLFIFDTKSGRLLGRTGITIQNFLNDMREKFEGSIVMTNTFHGPYSPQRPQSGAGGWKTSGHKPSSPKTSQGGAGGWNNSSYDPSLPGYGPHLPQRPTGGASGSKTSGYDPYSPKTSQGGSEDWENLGNDPHLPQRPQDGTSGWKTSGQGPYSPKTSQDGSEDWKKSGIGPHLPQKLLDGASDWKSSGHDPYSPHGPLHNDFGWESLGEEEKGYYESNLIIDGRKQ